jgi:hypothetical protein
MALSHRLAPLIAGYLSLLGAPTGGCRTLALCTSEGCSSEGVQAGGSATGGKGSAGEPAQGAETNEAGAAGGVVGEVTTAGEGGGPDELSCALNFADCDHSRFTGCESDVTWSVRHCGGCGQLCDGLCLGGRCEPTVLVEPTYAVSMVASDSTGFALVSKGSGSSLLIVDLGTASADVLVSNVDSDTMLAASADRVYLLDRSKDVLQSARLDGSDLKLEEATRPVSVGGTAQGAYYVNVLTHPEPEEGAGEQQEYQLYFRAKGSQTWQVLYQGAKRCKILSSSASGMVLARYPDEFAEDADADLSLWIGVEENPFGHSPVGFLEAAAVQGGYLVALTDDVVTNTTELWWLKAGEEPVHYEVMMPSNNTGPELTVLEDKVVLYFEDHGKAFVQHFSASGPELGRQGIIPASNIVWVDRDYIWYGVYDSWVTMRFLRSTWWDVLF